MWIFTKKQYRIYYSRPNDFKGELFHQVAPEFLLTEEGVGPICQGYRSAGDLPIKYNNHYYYYSSVLCCNVEVFIKAVVAVVMVLWFTVLLLWNLNIKSNFKPNVLL